MPGYKDRVRPSADCQHHRRNLMQQILLLPALTNSESQTHHTVLLCSTAISLLHINVFVRDTNAQNRCKRVTASAQHGDSSHARFHSVRAWYVFPNTRMTDREITITARMSLCASHGPLRLACRLGLNPDMQRQATSRSHSITAMSSPIVVTYEICEVGSSPLHHNSDSIDSRLTTHESVTRQPSCFSLPSV